jgi:PEP-CTERM motif
MQYRVFAAAVACLTSVVCVSAPKADVFDFSFGPGAFGTFTTGAASPTDPGFDLITGLTFDLLSGMTDGGDSFSFTNVIGSQFQDGAAFNPATDAFINHFGGLTVTNIGDFDLSPFAISIDGISFRQASGVLSGTLGFDRFDIAEPLTITKETAVPEPSTWTMMLVGFAGLGFASYRARKIVASVPELDRGRPRAETAARSRRARFLHDARMQLRLIGMSAWALAGMMLSPATHTAVVVYDGGPPALTGPSLASAPFMDAASFTLSAGANAITGAEWWGSCPSRSCPETTFDVSVYFDASGSPGALVASLLTDGSANQMATGEMVTFPGFLATPEYVYGITFAPLTLTAGNPYWLVIQETAPIPEPESGWGIDHSSAPPSSQRIAIWDGTEWRTSDTGLGPAFNLTGGAPSPVPEPSTWAMMLLGFGSLGFAGWRSRSRSGAVQG